MSNILNILWRQIISVTGQGPHHHAHQRTGPGRLGDAAHHCLGARKVLKVVIEHRWTFQFPDVTINSSSVRQQHWNKEVYWPTHPSQLNINEALSNNNEPQKHKAKMQMKFKYIYNIHICTCIFQYNVVSGVEPNFEDLDLVVDQADGETVDVDQADPHSNNIHVAHNNPKDRSGSTTTTVNTTCVQTLPLQWHQNSSEQPIQHDYSHQPERGHGV